MESEPRYDAFISYRHVEPDRRWARWLHRSLENYRIPKALSGRRLGRVFRDEEELAASADLSRDIEAALAESRFLIVVCSPRTPASRWIEQEIVRFRELGRGDRILALLIEGEPAEAFPAALLEIRQTPVDDRAEPLAADVRHNRGLSRRSGRRLALLRLLAPLLGTRFDDLRQREQERRMQRLKYMTAAAAGLAAVFAFLTWLAIAQTRQATRRLAQVYAEQGAQFLNAGDPERALPFLSAAYDLSPEDLSARFWLARAIENVPKTILMHPSAVEHASFDAQHKLMASGADDGFARVWEVATGRLLRTVEHTWSFVWTAMLSSDGKRLLTTGSGEVAIWNVADGRQLWVLGSFGDVRAATFSPDERSVLIGTSRGEVTLWETNKVSRIRAYQHDQEQGPMGITAVAFSRDGTRVAAAGWDGMARVWETELGILVLRLEHPGVVRDVEFNGDGTMIVTAADDGVRIWDAPSGRVLRTVQGHAGEVMSAAFSADDRFLITAGSDRTARIYDVRSGRALATIRGHTGTVHVARFSEDGQAVFTASDDRTVRIWPTSAIPLAAPLERRPWFVEFGAWDRSRSRVATIDGRGAAVLWDAATARTLARLAGHTGSVKDIDFDSESRRVVTASTDETARVWDVASGRTTATLAHPAGVTSAVFSPDGRHVLTTAADDVARLWMSDTGSLVAAMPPHEDRIVSAAFSPDGTKFFTASEDSTVRVMDAEGKQVQSFALGVDVVSAAFAEDGLRIAAGGARGVLRVLNIQTGIDLPTPATHTGTVRAVTFNGDGTRIASAGSDATARISDAETGALLFTLAGSSRDVRDVAFNVDGTLLLTVAAGGEASLWNAGSGRLLMTIEGAKFRTIVFSNDSSQIVGVTQDGMIVRRNVTFEQRDSAAVRRLVRDRVPWRIDAGRLVPVENPPESILP